MTPNAQYPLAARYRVDGQPAIRFQGPVVYYKLDEAARMLAYMRPVLPPKFGINTISTVLSTAAKEQVTPLDPDPEMVDTYRRLLIKFKVYPDPDTPPAPEPDA